MYLEPQYNENIVSIIKKGNKFNWYVTERELLIMDIKSMEDDIIKNIENDRLKKIEMKKELIQYHTNSARFRFNIEVLSNETIDKFLKEIKIYCVTTEELKEYFKKHKNENNVLHNIAPSLYFDFDKEILYSFMSEYYPYEKYLAMNWKEEYCNFYSRIPRNYKYWILDGKNYLE